LGFGNAKNTLTLLTKKEGRDKLIVSFLTRSQKIMTSKNKIRPLGNRVLIQRSKAQTSKGGILLPDTAQEKPKEGVVVSVGPGKTDENGKIESMNVKVGDRVLFSSYSGTEVKDLSDEEEFLVMSEDDILGVLS
jgi:chaperonin GroES